MLTKKGSTRGTVSVLFLSALIFLVARFAVDAIESAMPNNAKTTVAWKPIPDFLKDGHSSIMVDDEIESKTMITETSIKTDEASNRAIDEDADTKAKLIEAKKILDSQPTEKSNSEKSGDSKPPTIVKKTTKKRFALEKIFPDNVEQRPILIFFTDEGSSIAQKMENTSLGIRQVREKIDKEYYPIKIRFDKKMTKTEYRLYQEYGSTAVPVLHIVTATGEPLVYNSGFISAIKVMVLLNNAQRKLTKLEEKAD